MKVIHLGRTSGGREDMFYRAACGRLVSGNMSATSNPEWVTCLRCKETVYFRTLLPQAVTDVR